MKKILTAKELRDYCPGMECTCSAWNDGECCCDADWTPREVYKLRLVVKQLKARLKKAKQVGEPSPKKE